MLFTTSCFICSPLWSPFLSIFFCIFMFVWCLAKSHNLFGIIWNETCHTGFDNLSEKSARHSSRAKGKKSFLTLIFLVAEFCCLQEAIYPLHSFSVNHYFKKVFFCMHNFQKLFMSTKNIHDKVCAHKNTIWQWIWNKKDRISRIKFFPIHDSNSKTLSNLVLCS